MHVAEPVTDTKLDQLCVNTIRTLSIDAVQQARSGHPGTPMALAPLVYTLWNRVMRFDPQDAIWPNRDRFVLSNGHASMLLWSVLHLTGTRAVNADYERLGQPAVTLGDIRHFRQLDSKAPGHPEYHWVSGVETTSGPLGQGVATSVGMAIGQKWLASRYNRPGFDIFDSHVYAVCGDGCLMEGVAAEAANVVERHRRLPQSLVVGIHRARPGQMQDRPEQHRGVTVREHEPIAVWPDRILRIEAHHAVPDRVDSRRQRHRGPGVPRLGALDRIDRERADRVDRKLVELGVCHRRGDIRHTHRLVLVGWSSRSATLLRRRRCRGAWLYSAARNVCTSSQATLGPTVRPPRQRMFM